MSINEEDYIDMVLTTSSPSKNTVEFEFQMSFSRKDQTTQDDDDNDNNNTTSPADELFYKGKLLPLHLPPRQQMVENLASGVPDTPSEEEDHNYYYHSMPLIFSRTISPPPSKSCRTTTRGGSGTDRDSEEYDRFFDFPGDRTMKKPWSEKLKLVKHPSVIGQKLKASSAYLKSLFTKSVCLEESNRNPGDDQNLSKGEALLNKYLKNTKKQPLGYISRTSRPKIATLIIEDNNNNVSRRSFSGAIKRHSPTKCLSSSSSWDASSSSLSSSFKSNGQCAELNIFRRSSSVNEIEASIDAAIEHCKKSMQIFSCNINLGEDGKKAKSLK